MYSRRDVLKISAGAAGAGLLAACVAPGMEMAGDGAAVPREQRQGVMWGLQYDPHVEAYQRLSDLFAEQGGGTFEVQPQAWPIPPKVIAALAAREGFSGNWTHDLADLHPLCGEQATPERALRPVCYWWFE